MIVQYTPGQLRSILGVPQETYRHWEKALAPLRRDRGHSPSFTAGDLLAVELMRVLSADLSIRVGALAPIVSSVFEQCNTVPWPILERGAFRFDLPNDQALFQADLEFLVPAWSRRPEGGFGGAAGRRLPRCGCCTKHPKASWNRNPRPTSRRRYVGGSARSCCPSRSRPGARSQNSSSAACWPAAATSRRRSWP